MSAAERSQPRLREVAERSGVSVKTVSNVVNGYLHVAPGTRERVQRAIEELGYRPNASARSLRGGRTGIVALAVPDLGMPYFAELAGWVIDAAARHGWTVLIEQTDGVLEREVELLEGPGALLVDGVILSPLALGPEELRRRRERGPRVPLVLVGEKVDGSTADHVAIDNAAAARTATGHLLGLGRRRVAAIGRQESPTSGTSVLRLRGHTEALAAAGVPVEPALLATAERWYRRDGALAMAALLDLPAPPDAVFCFSDLLGLGALRELGVRGVRVPEDVAVVGFDDIEDGAYSLPSLTTIAPDKEALATAAVDLLARRLQSAGSGAGIAARAAMRPAKVVVPARLLVRESTVGPARTLSPPT